MLRQRLLRNFTLLQDRTTVPGGLFGYLTAISVELTKGNDQ
jgi:hypothetical protein